MLLILWRICACDKLWNLVFAVHFFVGTQINVSLQIKTYLLPFFSHLVFVFFFFYYFKDIFEGLFVIFWFFCCGGVPLCCL